MDWRLERGGGEKRREGAGMIRSGEGEPGFEITARARFVLNFMERKENRGRENSGNGQGTVKKPLGFSRSSYNTQRDRAGAERTLAMNRLFLYVTGSHWSSLSKQP